MGSLLDYLFPKKGNSASEEGSAGENMMEFIKAHTVEMPGREKMVMIPFTEFEEMSKQAETAQQHQETVIETEEPIFTEEPKPKAEPVVVKPESVAMKPTTEESRQEPTKPETEHTIPNEFSDKLKELKELIERSNYKDGIIKDLHKEMERLNGNFYEDIRRPMIKSIIAIHRQMTGRVKVLEKNIADADTDYEKLYREQVKNMMFDMTAVSDTLEDEYDLEFFEPAVGDLYNPKEDNAIRVVATEDEHQDGMIQEVLYGGFKNTSTDRIFLKANVIVYKLKKQ